MALVSKNRMILAVIIVASFGVLSNSEVYNVGESFGWTDDANFDYKSWAASKNFRVGDTIVFEYNSEMHNLVRVSHKDFNTCNSTAPHAIYTSGSESFTIKLPIHMFFICSIPGHCEAGMKVDIRVPKARVPKQAIDSSQISTPNVQAPAPGPSTQAPALGHDTASGSIRPNVSLKLTALALAILIKFVAY